VRRRCRTTRAPRCGCGDVARSLNLLPRPAADRAWTNATEQADHAVATLLAARAAATFSALSCSWSDQYDRKIQIAGRLRAPTSASWTVLAERRFAMLAGVVGGGRHEPPAPGDEGRALIRPRLLHRRHRHIGDVPFPSRMDK
jgi:NADPH-dependent 2,4-dienoyl-CoA reductase/sulfur reductase-like enzyme